MNYFYQPSILNDENFLEGEEFIHCTKVLRSKVGSQIGLLDGNGGFYTTEITSIFNKRCELKILEQSKKTAKAFYHHIAIAPTKNIDRTEWFVEKACELGIDEISFILTKNSERGKIRIDRLQKKALSALKQSKSGYLTLINELTKLPKFLESIHDDDSTKYIGYVEEGLPYYANSLKSDSKILTLIGPEGDFNETEVKLAIDAGFTKISLGNNTLRTETAGITACQFVNFVNEY